MEFVFRVKIAKSVPVDSSFSFFQSFIFSQVDLCFSSNKLKQNVQTSEICVEEFACNQTVRV